ncbi:MAG: bifunctional enzyme CysN/CysC, partial [Candidatus Promineifilaceae bacterium]
VAVNKMDLVDYSETIYQEIVADFREFSTKLEVPSITFIPLSALAGDNVVFKSEKMPWYKGPALLNYLESVNVGAGRNMVDFRYPVQYVLRPNQNFRGYAGQIASGRISPGEEVVAFPSGLSSKVKSIVTMEGDLDEAVTGDSVVLTLEDEIDISRGDMIVRQGNLPHKDNRIDATICWMSETPFDPQTSYQLMHNTRLVRAMVTKLNYKIDVDTMKREATEGLALNEIGRVQLMTTQPLFFDTYNSNRNTGSFILIDVATNNTVAAGMIRGASREVDDLLDVTADEQETRRLRSENVVWDAGSVLLEERETLNKHQAAVLWFTGLSGSGKSTIAKALERKLYEMNVQTMFLDGDNLRHGLNGDLGFSAEDRAENVRRVSEVAALGFTHGNIVLASFISPYARDRDFARSIVPEGRFFEIFAKCDLEVLKRRDPKGLYEKALKGEIKNFTGISAPYEAPENPELIIETDVDSPETLVNNLIQMLIDKGVITG